MKVQELLRQAAGVVELKARRRYNYEKRDWVEDPHGVPDQVVFNGAYVSMYASDKKVLLTSMEKEVLRWKMKAGVLLFCYYSQGKMIYWCVGLSDLLQVGIKSSYGKRIVRVKTVSDFEELVEELDKSYFTEGGGISDDYQRCALVEKMK